jgi:Ca2+-transporting ATPase
MDGPPAVALGVEKKHGDVMNQPPRPLDEGLPNSRDIALIFFLGAVMVTGTLLVFFLAGGGVWEKGDSCNLHPLEDANNAPFDVALCEAGDAEALAASSVYADDLFAHASTMTFAVFIVFQLFNVMNCRSNRESAFKLGLFSNQWINYAFLFSLGLLLFFVQFAEHTIPLIAIPVGSLMSTLPLSGSDWMIIFAVAGSVFVIEEFRKFIVHSKFFTPGNGR